MGTRAIAGLRGSSSVVALALAVLATGCRGCPRPSSVAEDDAGFKADPLRLCHDLAEAFCDRVIGCGYASSELRDQCVKDRLVGCQPIYGEQIASGAVEVDLAMRERCLASIKRMRCEHLRVEPRLFIEHGISNLFYEDPLHPCWGSALMRGTLPVGSACNADSAAEECEVGTCKYDLDGGTRCGRCAAWPRPGEPCDVFGCGGFGVECRLEIDGGGRCFQLREDGEPCSTSRDCKNGSCVPAAGSGVCGLLSIGAPCRRDGEADCEEGSICEEDAGHCVGIPGYRGPCRYTNDCGDGTVCDYGQCLQLAAVGEPCGRCADGWCRAGVCERLPAEGESCEDSFFCTPPNLCFDNVCRRAAPVGGSCRTILDCEYFLICTGDGDGGICVQRPELGQPCTPPQFGRYWPHPYEECAEGFCDVDAGSICAGGRRPPGSSCFFTQECEVGHCAPYGSWDLLPASGHGTCVSSCR